MPRLICSLGLLLLITRAALAAQFDLIAWNVESGGTQRSTIGSQLGEYEDVDLWVLSEVHASNAQFYIAATGTGEEGEFAGLIGSTGAGDRLVIAYDSAQFELLEGFELIDLAMGGGRAPLIARLRAGDGGPEFLLVANHLYRGNAAKRLQQAIGLRTWAQSQTLPIVTAGDFNFDFDLPAGPGNEAFVEFGLADIFQWERPGTLTETNWSDDNDDGLNDHHSVLDFVWTAGAAQQWAIESEILVSAGDFPDNEQTTDHRPVLARINTQPAPGPLAASGTKSRRMLRIADARLSGAMPRSAQADQVAMDLPRTLETPRVVVEGTESPLEQELAAAVSASADFGRFEGRVSARWSDDDRNMELLEDFAYIDPQGHKWLAPRGSMINGASIPRLFWNTIGSPYTGNYRNASVVHDVACEERRAAWQDVHRMFYDACRCGGVGIVQAKLMYWAVYHRGPRWGEGLASTAAAAKPLTAEQLDAAESYINWQNPSLEELEALPPK